MVIKKMLSYKRSMLGLWATRGLFAISLASVYLLISMGYEFIVCRTNDDLMTLLSHIKTMGIILCVVYTAVFAALGWAIIRLRDHAKGGRWFMWTGAALILCTVLSFIFDMYGMINVEDAMASDEPSAWWESMPWEFVVLFVLFIVGYIFLSENDVRGHYARVADNSEEYYGYGLGGILLFGLWRGVKFMGIWTALIAFILLIAWACYMIKYVPLPSTASADASSADAPKEGNTEVAKMLAEDGDATMKKWLLIGAGVIVLLVLWLM